MTATDPLGQDERSSQFLRVVELLEELGCKPRVTGDRLMSLCPVHPDRSPSLGGRDGESHVLLKCYAGCRTIAVLRKLGLEWPDLQKDETRLLAREIKHRFGAKQIGFENLKHKPPDEPKLRPLPRGELRPFAEKDTTPRDPRPRPELVFSTTSRRYAYTDESGRLLYEIWRWNFTEDGEHRKEIRPWCPKRKTLGYSKRTRKVLYALPNVLDLRRRGGLVVLVESEDCACAYNGRVNVPGRTIATTWPGGATQWSDSYADTFAPEPGETGCRVAVVLDHDEAGWSVGREISRSLKKRKISCSFWIPLHGADLSEHLVLGYKPEQLVHVTEKQLREGPQALADEAAWPERARKDRSAAAERPAKKRKPRAPDELTKAIVEAVTRLHAATGVPVKQKQLCDELKRSPATMHRRVRALIQSKQLRQDKKHGPVLPCLKAKARAPPN